MDSTKEITKRISDMIEDGDIPIQEIADRIGVTRQQVRRWMIGQSEPGIYKLKSLCEIYRVSADKILGLPSSYKTQDRRKQ